MRYTPIDEPVLGVPVVVGENEAAIVHAMASVLRSDASMYPVKVFCDNYGMGYLRSPSMRLTQLTRAAAILRRELEEDKRIYSGMVLERYSGLFAEVEESGNFQHYPEVECSRHSIWGVYRGTAFRLTYAGSPIMTWTAPTRCNAYAKKEYERRIRRMYEIPNHVPTRKHER